MKKLFLVAGFGLLMNACTPRVGDVVLKTEQDSISYALGVMLGNGAAQALGQFPVDTVDAKYLAMAFAKSKPSERYLEAVKAQLDSIEADVLTVGLGQQMTGKSKMTIEDANAILQKKAMAKREELNKQREIDAAKNEAEGKSFLEENKNAEGVVTLKSGLQYKVIKMGTGAKPKATDRVKCHYRGTLLDGTEFDASKEEPITFSVQGVIAGWTEALQLMPVGSKWQLFIPSNLAYGPRGGGEKIGPNATLIFDIELVDIVK